MTLKETFSTSVDNADFLCDDWGVDHCDPDAWPEPSTYGIDGVELVGEKHMKFFSDYTGVWTNPGRKNGTTEKGCIALANEIDTNGINTKGDLIYFDVDLDAKVNGGHREGASEIRGIPGWMSQGVRFRDEAARIIFANVSNIKKRMFHQNPSQADVEASVRELIDVTGEFNEDYIRRMVNLLGAHLDNKQKNRIIGRLVIELKFDGTIKNTDRYQGYNDERLKKFFSYHKSNDWIASYLNSDTEYTLYFNMEHYTHAIGTLIALNAEAKEKDKPLHMVFTVGIPKERSSETLQTRREKIWSKFMPKIERDILDSVDIKVNDRNRECFRWNHPDCVHVAVAQDNINELPKGPFVRLKNRDFN